MGFVRTISGAKLTLKAWDMTTIAPPDETSREQGPLKPLIKAVGLTAGLGAILVLLLLIFIMPSLKSGPHDLVLGVVAPDTEIAAVETAIANSSPGSFALVPFDNEEALAEAIRSQSVRGGLVLKQGDGKVLVASAGSAPIAASIGALGQSLGAQVGEELQFVDLVPLPSADPSGIGIGGLAFPLVFGGIVPVVAFSKMFPRSRPWALGGIAVFAGVGGLIVSALLTFVFGSVDVTAFWAVAGAVALGVAALAVPLAGLQEVFGGAGFTIGAMVMMFLGNPLAGIGTTGAWLPSGWGDFGQLLPPGAAGTLVRAAAYFEGAGGTQAALTLAGWVGAGIVLCLVAITRSRVGSKAAA